jgi:hypothetical protein
MKILHGMTEMANQAAYSVLGLRENGYLARSATRTFNLYALPADFVVAVGRKSKFLYPWYALQTLAFALYAILAFDVFHFHAEFSLIPGHHDLPLLRRLKKTITSNITVTSCAKVRRGWREIRTLRSFPDYGSNPEFEEGAKKVLAHAAGAIVHDGEIALYLPSCGSDFFRAAPSERRALHSSIPFLGKITTTDRPCPYEQPGQGQRLYQGCYRPSIQGL